MYVRLNKRKIIFIIGTGRSGTNWLGRILSNNPKIYSTIEKPDILELVLDIAIKQKSKKRKLFKKYKKEFKKAYPYHYLDKSHPNLWLFEDLLNQFKNAYFIGMLRNPYAIISSMIHHTGTMTWQENYFKFPIPNKFLGITEQNYKYYESYSKVQKAALRVASHIDELTRLKTKYPERLLLISYEELIDNPDTELKKIENFLDLKQPLKIGEIRYSSKDKWKSQLSKMEIREIFETHLELA